VALFSVVWVTAPWFEIRVTITRLVGVPISTRGATDILDEPLSCRGIAVNLTSGIVSDDDVAVLVAGSVFACWFACVVTGLPPFNPTKYPHPPRIGFPPPFNPTK